MQKGWVFVDGKWYFLQDNGLMVYSQWFKWNGVWYYFNSDGSVQNRLERNRRQLLISFNDSAKMQTGWVNDSVIGFILPPQERCLPVFKPQKVKGITSLTTALWLGLVYRLPCIMQISNGVIQTGWQYIKGEWYYFNYTGTMMHIGRLVEGGYTYYMNESTG